MNQSVTNANSTAPTKSIFLIEEHHIVNNDNEAEYAKKIVVRAGESLNDALANYWLELLLDGSIEVMAAKVSKLIGSENIKASDLGGLESRFDEQLKSDAGSAEFSIKRDYLLTIFAEHLLKEHNTVGDLDEESKQLLWNLLIDTNSINPKENIKLETGWCEIDVQLFGIPISQEEAKIVWDAIGIFNKLPRRTV